MYRVRLALTCSWTLLSKLCTQGREGLVHHSDRGCQYLPIRYAERLIEAKSPTIGRQCRRLLRQCVGRALERALQDRGHPTTRPLERRRGCPVCDLELNRLVQQQATARAHPGTFRLQNTRHTTTISRKHLHFGKRSLFNSATPPRLEESVSVEGGALRYPNGNPPSAAYRHRSAPSQPEKTSAKGVLQLVTVPGEERRLDDTVWMAKPASDKTVRAVRTHLDDHWRLGLQVGRWDLKCEDSSWILEKETVSIERDKTVVLTARRAGPLTISVRSVKGLPVPGAHVSLAPVWKGHSTLLPGRELSHCLEWTYRATTGITGQVIFARVPGPGFVLGVQADGFTSRRLTLLLPIADVDVVLSEGELVDRFVTIVDHETDIPITNPSMKGPFGDYRWEALPGGVFQLKVRKAPGRNSYIVFSAPGYCTSIQHLSRLKSKNPGAADVIRLAKQAAVRFVGYEGHKKVIVWLRLKSFFQQSSPPFLPRTVTVGAGQDNSVVAPVGATVAFSAISSAGCMGGGEFIVADGQNRVDLALNTAKKSLHIYLKDKSGQKVLGGRAIINYRFGAGRRARKIEIKASRDGHLIVPAPGGLRFIDILAAGYGPLRLVDEYYSDDVRKSGELHLTMRKSCNVKFTCRNRRDEPARGVTLIIDERGKRPVVNGRHLQGKQTGHPIWVVRQATDLRLQCDAKGQVEAQLPTGVYGVYPSRPSSFLYATVDGYLGNLEVFSVEKDCGVKLEVPAMRAIVVEGYDAVTREPLPSMQVNGSKDGVGTGSERRGGRHELILPDTCKELWVGSRGYFGRSFPITDNGAQVIRALLYRRGPMKIWVRNLPEEFDGQRVSVSISRYNPGAPDAMTSRVVSIFIDKAGHAELDVALQPPVSVRLFRQKVGDRFYHFRAIQGTWYPGTTVVFEATSE